MLLYRFGTIKFSRIDISYSFIDSSKTNYFIATAAESGAAGAANVPFPCFILI